MTRLICCPGGKSTVTIPDGVTSIGYGAFRGCYGLTAIHFAGTSAQWEAISKGSYWKDGASIEVVHCSDGDVTP